jgi:hypothetical protein
MSQRARQLARDILIGARVVEIKRRALAAAAAGGDSLAPAPPAAAPFRRLTLVPINDHGRSKPRPVLIFAGRLPRRVTLVRRPRPSASANGAA